MNGWMDFQRWASSDSGRRENGKPRVRTLSLLGSAPPQHLRNVTHLAQGPCQLIPQLQKPTRPSSRAFLGSLPRGPQKPPLPPFNFTIMNLFASPTAAEMLALPDLLYSKMFCNPRAHLQGSALERAIGWVGRSLEKAGGMGIRELRAFWSGGQPSRPAGIQT